MFLVQTLTKDPEVDVNYEFSSTFPKSALYVAIRAGHVRIVKHFLNIVDRPVKMSQFKPLIFEIAHEETSMEMLELLLENTMANVGQFDNHWIYVLITFANEGRSDVLKLLMRSERYLRLTEIFTADSAKAISSNFSMIGEHHVLVEKYLADPKAVRTRLMKEHKLETAGTIFAAVVFISDDYLTIQRQTDCFEIDGRKKQKARRFFRVAAILPMELQMILCTFAAGLYGTIIKREHSEAGFLDLARKCEEKEK